MAIRLTDTDYHELNAHYDTLRKGAAAFFGFEVVALTCAVTLHISVGGWRGVCEYSPAWGALLYLSCFLSVLILIFAPLRRSVMGGENLAAPPLRTAGAATARLAKLILPLCALATLPVALGFILFFFIGSLVPAAIVCLIGTFAKIAVFPKRNEIELIMCKSRELAGENSETPGSGSHDGLPSGRYAAAPQRGDGEVEVPEKLRRRLDDSAHELKSLLESGRQEISSKNRPPLKRPSGPKKPPDARRQSK